MAAVFITNAMLTQWSDQGKVRLDDTTLTLLQENRTVKLQPAVRFLKLIDGGDDPNKLLGKVKTPEQLTEMKAEHYMDSVILGDVGYTVVEGFLGDLSPPTGAAKAAAKPANKAKAKDAKDAPQAAGSLNDAIKATTKPTPAPVDVATINNASKHDDVADAQALSDLFLSTVKD
jgi:hypothetical protein